MVQRNDLMLSYDSVADVLYLSLGKAERSSRTREDDYGLLWRVAPSGDFRGVTVLGFQQLWSKREQELTGILAGRFNVPPTEITTKLQLAD